MIRIAIDGPSGAGKSTVAKRIAHDLSIIYVDTGAMYRCIGLYVLRQGLDTKNEKAGASLPCADQTAHHLRPASGAAHLFKRGGRFTGHPHPESSMAASDVSAIPGVRAFLLGLQQEMAKKQSLIMDGRDIGTVVIPDAELKIFLTASNESRAKRRHLEYIQKGQEVTYEEILQDILRRDQQDSSRAAAPLRKADDAVLIDSTNLTFEQTVDAIKKLIVQRAAALSLSI